MRRPTNWVILLDQIYFYMFVITTSKSQCYISLLSGCWNCLAGQLTRSPPALVEHRLSLQLAHVLLSQGPTPDQVPGQKQIRALSTAGYVKFRQVSYLHSVSEESLQPSGITDARTGSFGSAQLRLPVKWSYQHIYVIIIMQITLGKLT